VNVLAGSFSCYDGRFRYLSAALTGGDLKLISSTIFRGLAAAALAACLALPAFADIKAFNAAVKAGDYKTAAAEADVIWKTWDIKDPQTAAVAREFGFAALVSGRNDLAKQFGQFLVEKGAALSQPDDLPLTSAILYRAAEFKLSSEGEAQRSALREALLARNSAPGVELTSVLAWQALYISDWNKADWPTAAKDAAAAAEFFKRYPASLLYRQREAEVYSGAADFLANRIRQTKGRNEYYDRMANLHDTIVEDINKAAPAARSALWVSKWRAEAWTYALAAFLQSNYEQTGSLISTKLEVRELRQPDIPQHDDNSTIPICNGEFEGRKLRYPENRAFQGLVGAVIARMETDEKGKVLDVEILSAVPTDGFAKGVADTLRTWSYKKKGGGACRLDSRNHLYKVSFFIS
jgi:hypothetical protein